MSLDEKKIYIATGGSKYRLQVNNVYPTEPSNVICSSFCASTANSMGS